MPIETHSFHHIHRVSPSGRILFELAVEFLQKKRVPLFPDDPALGSFVFRGGATVLLDQERRVRYAVIKRIGSDHRLERARQFNQLRGAVSAGAYGVTPAADRVPFFSIHRGY
jgi:hypothetical protein